MEAGMGCPLLGVAAALSYAAGLLGRLVAEDEAISIRTMASTGAPEWLQQSWESAKRFGLDQLSMEEIETEIDAARKARRKRQQLA
jgi:hypothetical protein